MNRRSLLRSFGMSALAAAVGEARAWEAAGLSGSMGVYERGEVGSKRLVLNQVGFLPSAEKVASVLTPGKIERSFEVYSEDKQATVFTGVLSAAMQDGASGDVVSLADFSAVQLPGTYRIESMGMRSDAFVIGAGVYREPLRVAMRAFYGQRCGCAVDMGGGYRHPACHMAGAYHRSSGRQGAVVNHGGWHDAGDYGRYVVNSGITTGTLLWAWELYPEVLRGLTLGIPESGGRMPDFLAEIRWNLEWMLQLQDEDGGVWHKQTSEDFCTFILPENDLLTSYILGTGSSPYKSSCATGDFAAVMAIAARCYGEWDAEFAARCQIGARRAWTWAVANAAIVFRNPVGISTGECGDKHCGDEILWASAELWRTTGEAIYEQAVLGMMDHLPPEKVIAAPSWENVAPMAYWSYLLADRKASRLAASGLAAADATTPDQLKARIRKQTQAVAEMLVRKRALSGYGNTLAESDYVWGSNSVAANQSLLLLMAHHFEPNLRFVEAALGNLNYLLGRNCFGVSWVTQVGTRPFMHPHHRPSVADGIAAPWPGLLSGGPNARPGDPVTLALPMRSPMRMWVDDARAYSVNEVAINWNAPLVFLLAGANTLVR